jgi:AcrR family transcriptional regulator
MILNAGLAAFTMEGLAKTASVSAPLVYNYFQNRQELLQVLLRREYRCFIDKFVEATKSTENFEDIVRISVATNFDHHAPGRILPLLLSYPEIAAAIRTEREQHSRQNARFLVRAAAKRYHLSPNDAQLVISMSSGASIAAAGYAEKANLNREQTIDLAVRYILAGLERIAET